MGGIIPIAAQTPRFSRGLTQSTAESVITEPHFQALPPLSLYIHLPWCLKKCPYCDFNSHEYNSDFPEKEYAAALIRDLESCLPQVWGRKIHSIFFGGGTPSLFSPATIDFLLQAIRAYLPLQPEAEITLEANPGTFEQQKFAEFRAVGINRLSIGIQSFQPHLLKALGRVHDDREAHRAVAIAQQFFTNINLDLMYGLPGQTLVEALADIQAARDYQLPHLSVYQLTLEPNTWFYHHPPRLPMETEIESIETALYASLADSGYQRYEISAFAQPAAFCVHNRNYWTFGDYLGIGAGAHGKITFPDRITREVRYKNPREYLQQAAAGSAVSERRDLHKAEVGFEFMLNALRLTQGVPIRLFAERTGFPLTLLQAPLREAIQRQWLSVDGERMVATPLGLRFLNDVLTLFLP